MQETAIPYGDSTLAFTLPILMKTATNSIAFLTPNDEGEEPSSGGRRGNLTV